MPFGSGTERSRNRRFGLGHRICLRSPRDGQSETRLTRKIRALSARDLDRKDRTRMDPGCWRETYCRCEAPLLASRLLASPFHSSMSYLDFRLRFLSGPYPRTSSRNPPPINLIESLDLLCPKLLTFADGVAFMVLSLAATRVRQHRNWSILYRRVPQSRLS